MKREKMTREQAIAFCEEKIQLHEKARDHIKATSDLRKDRISKIKYNTHVEKINAFEDIVELLKDQSDKS